MATAITSTEDSLNAQFDLRFGRAAWFCVLDEATGKHSFVANEAVNAPGGAGTKAAEKMVELGVTKVISGDFGPKAKDLLDKFNIQMVVLENKHSSIKEIILKLKN
jgi:predicted Fe-Mo cluster-binding NifX family protein